MLIAMPCCLSSSVNATLVNWLPWSELKIVGVPNRTIASATAEARLQRV